MRSVVGLSFICLLAIISQATADDGTKTYIIKIVSNVDLKHIEVEGVPIAKENTTALPHYPAQAYPVAHEPAVHETVTTTTRVAAVTTTQKAIEGNRTTFTAPDDVDNE
jgi:hypothetical protein